MNPQNPLGSTATQKIAPKNKVIAVVGPTGAGKTALGVALARHYNGIVISADSRQVYRGLDIGTNKEGVPGSWHGETARITEGIPQLLVDVAEPGTIFTLHHWLTEARRLIELVWQHNSLPIVVGGTGLYVSGLLEGYQVGGGRYAKAKSVPNFSSLVLMPDVDRDVLYQRSDQRFERIFDDLIKETESLVNHGVTHDWLEKIGLDYRFASYFLTRQMNREIAVNQFQRASRQYIRRQLTWWRHHNSPRPVFSVEDGERSAAAFVQEGGI